jgi:hypothetical protein
MFWSWPLDFQALQAALSSPVPWRQAEEPAAAEEPAQAGDLAADADDALADDARARAGVRLSDSVVAGRVVECLPPGPELAGWLALAEPRALEDGALAGLSGRASSAGRAAQASTARIR